jgi:hypothetical protein
MRLINFFISFFVLFNLFTTKTLAVAVGGRIYYKFNGLNIGLEKVAVFMEEIPSGITVYPDYKAFISQWETPRSYSDIFGTVVLTDMNGYYRFDSSNPCYKLTLDKAFDINNLITNNQITPTYGKHCEFKYQNNIQYQRFAAFFPYNYDRRSNINPSIFFEPNKPDNKVLKGGGTWQIVGNWVGATPEYQIIRENDYISILEAFVGWGILQASNWESYMAKTKQSTGFISGIDFKWLPSNFSQPVAKSGKVYCQDQSNPENKNNYIKGVEVSTENYNLYYFMDKKFPTETKITDLLGRFTLDDIQKHWGIGIKNPTLRNSLFLYNGAEYPLKDSYDKGLLNNNYFSTSDKVPLIHLTKQGSTHLPSTNPIYTFFLNDGRKILNYDTGAIDAGVSHFGYIGYAPSKEGPRTLPLFLLSCHIGCGGYGTKIHTTNINEVPNEYWNGKVAPRDYIIQPTKNGVAFHAYTFNIGYDQVGPWFCKGCEKHTPVNHSMGNQGVVGWIYETSAVDRKPLYRKSKKYDNAVYYAVTPNDGDEYLKNNWYTGSILLGYIDKYDNYKVDIGVDNCCVRPDITVHYPEANSQLNNPVYISGSSQMNNFNICKKALDNPDTVKIKITASDGRTLTTDCNINTITGDTANFTCQPDNNFFVNGKTYNYEITADNGALDSIYVNNFSIKLLKDAWWQTSGGDIYAAGDYGSSDAITSLIPQSCNNAPGRCRPYLMLNDGSGQGLALSYKGLININPQPANNLSEGNDWKAQIGINNISYGEPIYNYNFWFNHLKGKFDISKPWNGNLAEITENKIVYMNSGTITGMSDFSHKLVVLANSDLTINGNITIPNNLGSLIVISSGNINISPSVTRIDGYFIASGVINTGTNYPAGDNQLQVQGGLIGYGGVNLQRDFRKTGNAAGEMGNNYDPAEIITFRPDIFANLPEETKIKPIWKWKEVAP